MSVVNVLIVDDRKENLLVLESLLEKEGLNLVKANSGNEALSKLLDYTFALVILDVQMPDMNGFEVAELMRINEKTKHIPIIFVTAISKEDRYVFKGYEVGAVDYLSKPIVPEILRSKVDVFVSLYEQSRIIKDQMEKLEELTRELEEKNLRLKEKSNIDGLTGINNRRRMDEFILHTLDSHDSVGVIMMDIDYFKKYNDYYGHQQGDDCLINVANMLKRISTNEDFFIARYGGEEFIAIIYDRSIEEIKMIGQAIIDETEKMQLEHKDSSIASYVTLSVGIYYVREPEKELSKKYIDCADEYLYLAKRNGRNRVEFNEND